MSSVSVSLSLLWYLNGIPAFTFVWSWNTDTNGLRSAWTTIAWGHWQYNASGEALHGYWDWDGSTVPSFSTVLDGFVV
jgi:hypothetical protein